jgi:5-methylcytosine-specific restriction endonuclease McrA
MSPWCQRKAQRLHTATVSLRRQYCFKFGDTMDHGMPRSCDGRHVWQNVVCACRRCNAKKDDRTLAEIGWTLKVRPDAPEAWFYVVFKVEVDPASVPYLSAA